MLKALTAAAAVTICCLGNEYPAKSYEREPFDAVEAAANAFVEHGRQFEQEERMRQIVREEMQRYGSWN
jgi:hypothetical protein